MITSPLKVVALKLNMSVSLSVLFPLILCRIMSQALQALIGSDLIGSDLLVELIGSDLLVI